MKNSLKFYSNAKRLTLFLTLCLFLVGCASIDVTNTSSDVYPPTDPQNVEILRVTPYRAYDQLATFTVTGFEASQTSAMYYAMRKRAATLGADAVILSNETITTSGSGDRELLANGIAIHYTATQ